jgi:2-amino-4-hydroxy-6-hydroxymethyldihydropteridine diphosphokinase
MLERAYVGIGANLGDPEAQVQRALADLERLGRLRASSLYRSEPLGEPDQPWFVNAVAELETDLGPRALLDHLQALERAAGRPARAERWAPRLLDLDLLLHGRSRLQEAGLEVPHPRWRARRFVLMPLAELAPGLRDPISGRSVRQLLADLDDPLRCERMCRSPAEVPGP